MVQLDNYEIFKDGIKQQNNEILTKIEEQQKTIENILSGVTATQNVLQTPPDSGNNIGGQESPDQTQEQEDGTTITDEPKAPRAKKIQSIK